MAEEIKFDARLAEGIAYFEQMLDVLPDDRTTLEFLVVAYAQQGASEKEEAALARLARLMVRDGDLEALREILPRLETARDPQAKAILLRATALLAPPPDLTPEEPHMCAAGDGISALKRRAVEAERALAELLKVGDFISQREFSLITEQLDASLADAHHVLISTLQILEKENQAVCERAIAYLSDQFETPPVPLAAFDAPPQIPDGWRTDLSRLRGVVPFGKVGGVLLVAILNPADADLLAAVAEAAGSECRFFLAEPRAVESIVEARFGGEGEENA